MMGSEATITPNLKFSFQNVTLRTKDLESSLSNVLKLLGRNNLFSCRRRRADLVVSFGVLHVLVVVLKPLPLSSE